jgi:hypothetical protein
LIVQDCHPFDPLFLKEGLLDLLEVGQKPLLRLLIAYHG